MYVQNVKVMRRGDRGQTLTQRSEKTEPYLLASSHEDCTNREVNQINAAKYSNAEL